MALTAHCTRVTSEGEPMPAKAADASGSRDRTSWRDRSPSVSYEYQGWSSFNSSPPLHNVAQACLQHQKWKGLSLSALWKIIWMQGSIFGLPKSMQASKEIVDLKHFSTKMLKWNALGKTRQGTATNSVQSSGGSFTKHCAHKVKSERLLVSSHQRNTKIQLGPGPLHFYSGSNSWQLQRLKLHASQTWSKIEFCWYKKDKALTLGLLLVITTADKLPDLVSAIVRVELAFSHAHLYKENIVPFPTKGKRPKAKTKIDSCNIPVPSSSNLIAQALFSKQRTACLSDFLGSSSLKTPLKEGISFGGHSWFHAALGCQTDGTCGHPEQPVLSSGIWACRMPHCNSIRFSALFSALPVHKNTIMIETRNIIITIMILITIIILPIAKHAPGYVLTLLLLRTAFL